MSDSFDIECFRNSQRASVMVVVMVAVVAVVVVVVVV